MWLRKPYSDKGKPGESRGRKAMGLKPKVQGTQVMIARPPKIREVIVRNPKSGGLANSVLPDFCFVSWKEEGHERTY